MAITRVHHVSQIGPDFEEAQKVYVAGMGLAVDQHRSPLPGGRPGDIEGTSSMEFPIGEMFIEVSVPANSDSAAGKFLAERNGVGGMHHVAFASDDLEADVKDLQAKGLRFLSRPDGDASPLYFDPETTLGLLMELVADDGYYPHPSYRGVGLATGMAHVGIAARSEEEVTDLFSHKFGLGKLERPEGSGAGTPISERGDAPQREADDDVTGVEFPCGGTIVEISVPNDDVSGTARFLASRGGLAAWHHICPWAPDVHAFMDRGNAAGMRQLGSIPPKEETTQAVGWFHPRSALGTLIEVWNIPLRTP
jgi:methylmalonyl-CoA/ethylmalonyl-CoA epimerase